MNRPLIGLTTYSRPVDLHGSTVDLNGLTFSYMNAVRAAGGLPVLIPLRLSPDEAAALVQRLDGLLLTGGEDVAPTEYGQATLPETGKIDRDRDELELALARLAVGNDLPLLAICRGHQVLNVALGGTLLQDLSTQLRDAQRHTFFGPRNRTLLAHQVRLQPGSRLHALMGTDEVGTNSSHHQAIHELASRLVAVGHTPDGVIEAVELEGHPFALGLQWHPEGMYQVYPKMLRPFEGLVHAAQESRR